MFLTVPLNTSIFVLCRTSRFLEKCPSAQGKPPEEKGPFISCHLPLIHSLMTHILVSSRIQPIPLSGTHTILSLFPLILTSAISSFLFACVYQSPQLLVPYSLLCPLAHSELLLLSQSRARKSLSFDSYAFLSLSLVTRDIYALSTDYCSSYEPHP